MTLKAFHVVFVLIATLTTGGFGVWSLMAHQDRGEMNLLILGVFSLGLTVALLVYGNWFLKKMKDVSYL